MYSDAFMSENDQLRDKLSDLDEVVFTERLTTTIVDALPADKYSTIITSQAVIDSDLSLDH